MDFVNGFMWGSFITIIIACMIVKYNNKRR